MSESKVDLDADQNIPIPDKISSSCLSKLEMMVNKLGSLIKNQCVNKIQHLLTIVSKKSPAKVFTHLYFVTSNFDVFIVQRLATAISRMILLSTTTWKQISNLTPFFVPPRNSKTVHYTDF